MTGEDIVRVALSYVGVPEVHQGRDRNGVDCVGLLIAVGIEAGVPNAQDFLAAEFRAYGRIPPARLGQEMRRYLVKATGVAPGRVGLFVSGDGAFPSHVAIFGHGQMIHSYHPQRKVVVHGYRNPWPDRLRAVFAYPGIE